jgi:hypothetical protein
MENDALISHYYIQDSDLMKLKIKPSKIPSSGIGLYSNIDE